MRIWVMYGEYNAQGHRYVISDNGARCNDGGVVRPGSASTRTYRHCDIDRRPAPVAVANYFDAPGDSHGSPRYRLADAHADGHANRHPDRRSNAVEGWMPPFLPDGMSSAGIRGLGLRRRER